MCVCVRICVHRYVCTTEVHESAASASLKAVEWALWYNMLLPVYLIHMYYGNAPLDSGSNYICQLPEWDESIPWQPWAPIHPVIDLYWSVLSTATEYSPVQCVPGREGGQTLFVLFPMEGSLHEEYGGFWSYFDLRSKSGSSYITQ